MTAQSTPASSATRNEGEMSASGASQQAPQLTVADVHREVVLAQLGVAREALYQALLWSILPAGQGTVLTGPQAESLAFAKHSAVQLQREVAEGRRD